MRRTAFLGLAAALLILGSGVLVWHLLSAPTVLKLAVGPPGSEDARLMAAAAQHLVRGHEKLRFKLVQTNDEAASAAAIDDGVVDLALVRTDAGMPEKGQSVAIMHRDAAVLVAPASRAIASVADLKGHVVGVVKRIPANLRLLEFILAQSEVPKDEVRTLVLDGAADVEAALRSGRIDAVLAVGTVSGRNVADTVAAVTAAGAGAPVFVPVSEAEAIAQRSPLFEALDVVRGAFSGTPPRPAETFKTLGASHRLVAAASLPDATVSELTRLLFVMRPSLAATIPLANRIEGPDTSKSSSLPVHTGAAAYYDGEVQTFFERYEDWIYLGIMIVSVIGSAFAGLASTASSRRRARTLGLLDRLLGIVRLARAAGTEGELDALEHETDDILAVALGKAGTGGLDDAGVSAFTLGLDQARQAISERRRTLGRGRAPFGVAAE